MPHRVGAARLRPYEIPCRSPALAIAPCGTSILIHFVADRFINHEDKQLQTLS